LVFCTTRTSIDVASAPSSPPDEHDARAIVLMAAIAAMGRALLNMGFFPL
jgi:hypothetical protein